jgi:acyl-CoA dehydrogenase
VIPPFTERHEELRSEIRAFVAEELRPHAGAWERAGWFPNEVFARMGELGLLGLKYPREYGGRGGDHLDDAVLSEELSGCGSGGVSAGIGAHVNIATPPVAQFGTGEQKERFLALRSEVSGSPRSGSPSPAQARTWRASAPLPAAWTAATW